MKQAIPYILLIIGIIWYFSRSTPEPEQVVKIETKIEYIERTDTIYITIPKTDTLILPGSTDTIRDTVYQLMMYNSKRVIVDTIINDSSLNVTITDTLYKNNILSREINYKLYELTKTITITKPEPLRAALYYGGGIQANINRFDVELGLMFVPKKRRYILKLDYAIYHREISLGVYVKLGRH